MSEHAGSGPASGIDAVEDRQDNGRELPRPQLDAASVRYRVGRIEGVSEAVAPGRIAEGERREGATIAVPSSSRLGPLRRTVYESPDRGAPHVFISARGRQPSLHFGLLRSSRSYGWASHSTLRLPRGKRREEMPFVPSAQPPTPRPLPARCASLGCGSVSQD